MTKRTAVPRAVPRWACVVLALFFRLPAPGQEVAGDGEQAFRTPPADSRPGARPPAEGLPGFESDRQADRWLREQSPWYRSMAEAVDRSGGYTFGRTTEMPGGLAYFKDGRGFIELNDSLKGAQRVSVLIFELTNLYQERRHQEVADRVRHGELNNAAVFGLLRESIEYDGLRLHLDVLSELHPVLGAVPPEMIAWVSSTARSFAEYRLPFAYDYLKAQETSGHTAHYIRLFEKHRAEHLQAAQKGK
jgi:hypothetical protein